MANLTRALQELREERKQAQYQVEKLESAISVLEDLVGYGAVTASGTKPDDLDLQNTCETPGSCISDGSYVGRLIDRQSS
jgi:hypothetical protein